MITPGLEFTNPDHSRQARRKGEAFVDDTDIWVTETTLASNSIQTIVEGITTLFQRWYRALRTTGGMLGFDKCFWYLIKWEWKNGKPRMATIAETPAELIIATDDDRTTVTIQRLEPTKGLRTLGVRIAPTGNQHDEFQYRLTQAQQIAKLIYNAPLSRAETTIAHEQVWWPSIGFPLGVTTFSKAECNKLQAGFQAKFIAKMGYNRTMANAIRYGPQQYGGVGLRTIWTEQGLRHTLLALFHLRANDELGNTLQISIAASQLEAGIQQPILQTNWRAYGSYLTKTWITHTWEFLAEHNMQIRIPDVWTPQPQRQNDTFLMDHANVMYQNGAATRQKINRCRLFLRVTTLSDITDATGRHIEKHVWDGDRPKHRKTKLNYPTYERPPKQDWTVFRQFLQRLLTNPYDPKSKLTKHHTLGAWYKQRHEDWTTNYSPSTNRIYIKKSNNIYSYEKLHSHNTFNEHTRITEITLPNDTIPISITTGLRTSGIPKDTNDHSPQTTTHPRMTQTPQHQDNQFNKDNIPDDLQTILHSLPKWKKQRIENLELCTHFYERLQVARHSQTLGSASDGSAPYHGSFA